MTTARADAFNSSKRETAPQGDGGWAEPLEERFMIETKKKYKILIVDDSRFNRAVMTGMLGQDYYLEEACGGKQAIRILEDHAEEFSLVLLDIVMSHAGGFAFLKAMKKRGWLDFLPVVMISSEYTAENIEMAYRLGASDIIQRPYNEQVICHRIANTIALSGKQRELSYALVNEVIRDNQTSADMISILSHIVETRNGESGSHVQNIRDITGMLLEELMKVTNRYSFAKGDMFLICTASSLHDIGKMTIPEEILNKPGKLTEDELRIMRGHAMAGANMVDALRRKKNVSPLIQLTYEICRWHHERYDGRGYPDGLKGEEIPIAAQVVSVADVYDALIGERCYKPAYSHEQALQMILDGQCGAFNPLLLTCLSRISARLKAVLRASDHEKSAGDGADLGQEMIEGAVARLHDNGLTASEKIMQTLASERLRFKFFFNETYPAFYYTASPFVVHFNRAGMELLQLDEPVVELNREPVPHEAHNRSTIDGLRRKLRAATNEHPVVKETVQLNLPGGAPRQYQCLMQTIWDSADTRRYAEVVGVLLPMGGEIVVVPSVAEGRQPPVFGEDMTGKDVYYLINALKFMVYNVRLVDPISCGVMEIDSSGKLSRSDRVCYHIWRQERRCTNCTSMKCLEYHKQFSKIVFLDDEAFHVVSQYINLDGVPLVLETLTRITEDVLLDGNGERLPSGSISDMHSKLYLDPVTHAYNRRYYNMKMEGIEKICALAVLDVDRFRDINNAYGRAVGDDVLMRIAKSVRKDLRNTDVLVRYSGDEFVILFAPIAPDALEAKLNKICGDIAALSIDGMEDGRHVTVSIGGAIGPAAPAELFRKSDEMMRRAKQKRGAVEMWDLGATD